jgi:hypothetical protein
VWDDAIRGSPERSPPASTREQAAAARSLFSAIKRLASRAEVKTCRCERRLDDASASAATARKHLAVRRPPAVETGMRPLRCCVFIGLSAEKDATSRKQNKCHGFAASCCQRCSKRRRASQTPRDPFLPRPVSRVRRPWAACRSLVALGEGS